MHRPGRLEGKNCLIVGGSSGIGLASAQLFLEEGARVVAAGRPHPDATAMPKSDRFTLAEIDLSNGEPAVSRLFALARDILGNRLDILLHVAGISGRQFGDGPLHDCTSEGWDHVMAINARAAFLTNRAAVRIMRAQPLDATGLRGTVVNVGSVLDRSPSPANFGTIAYAASKGALRAITLSAASAYASERIRFNLLVPGLIDTPMAARAVNNPRIREYLQRKQPIASGPGAADDVARAALYLCEPAARFVTGAELVVDGGWTVCDGSPTTLSDLPTEPLP